MTEVEIYQPPRELALPPASDIDSWIAVAEQVVKLAREICNTPFIPDGLRGSAPATAAAILAGREMGLGPMTSLQHIHVIKGKPGQSALLMRALIISAGHEWQDVDVSDVRVVVKGRRKGEPDWAEASFTAQQAKTAGIALGGYPQDKLYARATVRLARRKFADVIMGMPYSAEELEDGADSADGVVLSDESRDVRAEIREATAKPRTAQRRQRAGKPDPTPPPAGAPPAGGSDSTGAPAPAQTAPADGLPPLPGEDEPDPTAAPPGAATGSAAGSAAPTGSRDVPEPPTTGQVGIIQSHFARLGFGGDDKREPRLIITAQLAGRQDAITSTKDLTRTEATAVADTLSRCKTRTRLLALVDSGEGDGDA